MVFFKNVDIEIYTYIQGEGYDDYGVKSGNYEYRETVGADMQPMSSSDTVKEFGEVLLDMYKIYVDYDVDIFDTDIIMVKGKPEKYIIQGSALEWNHLIDFKKIIVKLQRRSYDGYGCSSDESKT